MNKRSSHMFLRTFPLTLVLLVFIAAASAASEYAALERLERLDTVIDYGHASPEAATVVFPAVRQIYQDQSVKALPNPPRTVIVFHGEAVKFLSNDRQGFDETQHETLDTVAEQIRQFHEDGVRMEVCMYAVRVFGVDPDTLMTEIEQVGNGFISVAGYQNQGYAVIAVP